MKNNPILFDVIQNLSITNMNIELNAEETNDNKNQADELDDVELAEMLKLVENELTPEPATKISEILAIMGICICMIGIVGNFFSIIVLNRKSMKKLSTYAYLLGLSICDEICLISTVYTLLQHVLSRLALSTETKYLYKKSLIYVIPIPQTFQALSVWITMAFTFDRYLYVCQPFYGRKYCTRKRAFLVLICLYTLAFIYSIPQFFERRIIKHEIFHVTKSFLTLSEFGEKPIYIKLYHGLIYCVFVVFIPFTTIVILNGFLIYDIIKSNKRHRGLSLNYRPSVSIPPSGLLVNANNTNNSRRRKSLFLICLLNRKNPSNSNKKKLILENKNKKDSTEPCLSNENNRQSSILTNENQNNHTLSYDKYFTLRNDVTIMLIGLIVVFLICQFPSTILRLVLVFNNLHVVLNRYFDLSLNVSNVLVVTSSTLNCILYVMLGKKFRKEFLATFSSKCCCKNNDQNNSFNYYNNNNRTLRASLSVNVNNQI